MDAIHSFFFRAPVVLYLLHLAAWLSLALFAWLWLRKELTPKRFLSIFETDNVLSSRQILAWVLAIWGLSMRSAGRLDNDGLRIALEMAVVLFGIGGAAKAAASLRSGNTTVNTKNLNAKVDAENVTFPAASDATKTTE